MTDIEMVFLLSILLANLIMTGLIYRKLTSMLDEIKQINRRLRCKAMLRKRADDKEAHNDE